MTLIDWGIEAAERGLVPDRLMRQSMRRLCEARLDHRDNDQQQAFINSLASSPIALATDAANRQHYELPPAFFQAVLGPRLKYSCCYFATADTQLPAAEDEALSTTCLRAELCDGQRILELGCGWGSLSLWMATRYPQSSIVAVSNSHTQREFIEQRACTLGIQNLRVITADINTYDPGGQSFDRVVSVEMFEHTRNLDLLLQRISGWITDDGKLFVHIFCHRHLAYPFALEDKVDWMSKHFFTGGMMPSYELLPMFNRHLKVVQRHEWSGLQYRQTAEAWLANLDANRSTLLPVLAATYGASQAGRWFRRWRMFFMAVSEMFAIRDGKEWFVGHYLFERNRTTNL